MTLVIGADGLPLLAAGYCAPECLLPELHTVHCAYPSCSSLTISGILDVGRVGHAIPIIGRDGLPLIFYTDTDRPELKVIHCPNVLCNP